METEQRQAVIKEAIEWQGTPYHPCAKIKGVGCDCLTMIAGVFENVELIPPVKIPYYPPDWHLHQDGEKYYEGVLQYAREVETPGPGDIALWKFGRCFSHGAIVIDFPRIIHSVLGMGALQANAENDKWLKFIDNKSPDAGKLRPVKFFSFWGA